jgi:transposase-like protein
MKSADSFKCPHCKFDYGDESFDYIEVAEMDGEFDMVCDQCLEHFQVKFTTTINYTTSKEE